MDTLEVDMVSTASKESLYITYSKSHIDSENILKYDLPISTQSVIAHPDISESRQLEISENSLFSIGIDRFFKMDLENLETVNTNYSIFFYSKAIKHNNDIL